MDTGREACDDAKAYPYDDTAADEDEHVFVARVTFYMFPVLKSENMSRAYLWWCEIQEEEKDKRVWFLSLHLLCYKKLFILLFIALACYGGMIYEKDDCFVWYVLVGDVYGSCGIIL